jgi:uncharacterized protein (DUF2235 family)
MPWTAWRTFYNWVSRATGLGLTRNIVDCYAALIRMGRPGDRIFLFGFSRGAYTVRSADAGVLSGEPCLLEAARIQGGWGEITRRP